MDFLKKSFMDYKKMIIFIVLYWTYKYKKKSPLWTIKF